MSVELNSVTNAIFNFQSQVGAIPVFSCKRFRRITIQEMFIVLQRILILQLLFY